MKKIVLSVVAAIVTSVAASFVFRKLMPLDTEQA